MGLQSVHHVLRGCCGPKCSLLRMLDRHKVEHETLTISKSSSHLSAVVERVLLLWVDIAPVPDRSFLVQCQDCR